MKRNLSDQQIRRQEKQHEEHLDVGALEGEVCAHLGSEVIAVSNGIQYHLKKRQHVGSLVTGDKIRFVVEEGTQGVCIARLDRTNVLVRQTPRGVKPLVANVSQMCVVLALEPPPALTTLERYLIASQLCNIPVIVALNKCDLAVNTELLDLKNAYEKIGVRWFNISVSKNILSDLPQAIKGKHTVMVGQSGVGKSSLISLLTGQVAIAGGLTGKGKQGAHTTSRTEYYWLEDGVLIDSPGTRQLTSLYNIAELITYFTEFTPYIGKCAFRNCKHIHEPRCAIIEASERGEISTHRWEVYKQLLGELIP